MSRITSLKSLISNLNRSPNHLTLNVCKSYIGTDWKKYVIFKDKTYHRNTVYGNDKFDLFILSWKKGQISDVHFHDKQCVFKVLSGSFAELRSTNKIYANAGLQLREYQENILHQSDTAKILRTYHLVKALNDFNVSLHVYHRL